MQATKFHLGEIVMTSHVAESSAEDPKLRDLIPTLIGRHHAGDWGDLCAADKKENEFALTRYLRLFSSYNLPDGGKIWIITEADRSVTTVLFPEDY